MCFNLTKPEQTLFIISKTTLIVKVLENLRSIFFVTVSYRANCWFSSIYDSSSSLLHLLLLVFVYMFLSFDQSSSSVPNLRNSLWIDEEKGFLYSSFFLFFQLDIVFLMIIVGCLTTWEIEIMWFLIGKYKVKHICFAFWAG